eukprot:jgi/Astpho2/9864/Aster-08326
MIVGTELAEGDNETEKRHGAGRGNWGTDTDEVKEQLEKTTGAEDAAEAAAEEPAELTEEQKLAAEEEAARIAEAEAEAKEMTLDEWEALNPRATKEPATKKPNKALQDEFKGMQAVQPRKDKEEVDTGLELVNKRLPKQQRDKALKEKETVETGFRVGDEPSRGGGRGRGRGEGGSGGRGGRGRDGDFGGERRGGFGGDRPPAGVVASSVAGGPGGNINVEDQQAFPTLGGK